MSAPSEVPEQRLNDPEVLTLLEILPDSVAIDTAKLLSFVRHHSCGAIATFSGTTRSTFNGNQVLHLIYESYVPMALKTLRSIADGSRTLWNLHGIAIAHRLGVVSVGEESVFISVSSVHRDDALSAVGYIIDELKAKVPIWKKEVMVNGEVWKENPEFLGFQKGGKEGEHEIRVRVEGERRGGCCSNKELIAQ